MIEDVFVMYSFFERESEHIFKSFYFSSFLLVRTLFSLCFECCHIILLIFFFLAYYYLVIILSLFLNLWASSCMIQENVQLDYLNRIGILHACVCLFLFLFFVLLQAYIDNI